MIENLYYATNKLPLVLTKESMIPFVFKDGEFIPLSIDDLDKKIEDYKIIVRRDIFDKESDNKPITE